MTTDKRLEAKLEEITRLRAMTSNPDLKPFLRSAARGELKRAISAYNRLVARGYPDDTAGYGLPTASARDTSANTKGTLKYGTRN
jgi:hypothetical protein